MSRPADDYYVEKPPLNINETDVIPMIFDLAQKGKLDWKVQRSKDINVNDHFICTHNGVELKIYTNGTLYLDKYKFTNAKHIYDIINDAIELSESTRASKLINKFFKGLI